MTAKEFVIQHTPNARAERHRTRGPLGRHYYLIRDGRATYPMGEGDTESKAWVDAKRKIEEDLNPSN